MQLGDAALAIGARYSGGDGWFEGISTDTRTLRRGALFCALKGPKYDGHEHCAEAEQKGACGAIVERDVDTSLSTLVVPDSRRALGRLAQTWRRRFSTRVVGVTGSNGKTTVKEMIAAILRTDAPVLATQGNLNNDIGVPQTLFQLADEHEYAVIEMGANHLGEIEWLAEIAQPLVGVITLCAPSHLEGFGSIENVAQAKGELYTGLLAEGTAVVNADDDFAAYWNDIAKCRRVLRFGLKNPADVTAANVSSRGIGNGMHFTLGLPSSHIDIDLPFDGLHNVSNALAAATVAFALDVAPTAIKSGLENTIKVDGRLCMIEGRAGCRIIDDTYNANPASLAAAIDVLASVPGSKWLVLGDMGELGPSAAELHRIGGAIARDSGIERLYAFGELAANAADAFGEGAQTYGDMGELISALQATLSERVTLLVKGSRTMRMERIVDALAGVKPVC